MKKDNCDRIIVETNAKMQKVIDWYLANKGQLDQEEFRAPMDSGCIVLQEENIEVTFESKGDEVVELAVYPLGSLTPAITYDYCPGTKLCSNYRYPAHLSSDKLMLMKAALISDRTDYKEAIKYHSLMLFSVHYKEIIHVDEKQNKVRTKHEAKQLRKSPGQPLSLIKKTYVVNDFDQRDLKKHGEKRAYTKPDHECSVKGYYRISKNGEKTWVKPYTRYKRQGNKQNKEYRI